MRKADLLFISQYYPPELLGSAPFVGDLAEWFRGAGHRVTVLTGLPNYPDGEIFPAYRAGERRREEINGVSVERLSTWVPRRRTAFARIASEVFFFLRGSWAIISRRVRRQRLVVTLCPSILAVLLGTMARRRTGRHIVVVHDIQSGLAQNLDIVSVSWLLHAMRWCERNILNQVDSVVVLTEEMKAHLRLLGVTSTIEVLPIWADTERIRPVHDTQDQTARLIYSGSFGRKQNLAQILALAEDIRERSPQLEILLRGRGAEFDALRSRAVAQGLRNIQFSDLVPARQLFGNVSGADIHLVVHNASAANFAVPSKIYNIMAAGLPCVAQASPESPLARLQQISNGFLCANANDPRALADAALLLANDKALRAEIGRNGRRYVEGSCAKDTILDRFIALADRLQRGSTTRVESGVMIFEPEAEGHSDEWLRHLIRSAQSDGKRGIVWIVVAPGLYQNLLAELRAITGDQIRLLPLSRREARLCCHRRLFVSSFARWWIARRYLSRTRAAAVHFMSVDLLSLPLALGLAMKRRSISGILFRPSTHYRYVGFYAPTWREKLRDLRKGILYRLMLSNRRLTTVLTLDPYFARYAARFYRNGEKIRPVADPTIRVTDLPRNGTHLVEKIPPNRVFFLFFGHLTERKGTLKLLDALQLLPAEVAAQVAVMLVGRVDPSIQDAVQRRFLQLQHTRPGLLCLLENHWVASGEIDALVERADVVLAPYQRFVGSSGVMMWAAGHGKPLLTQDFGLLKSLVEENRLGVTVDCSKPFALSEAIARLVAQGPDSFIDRAAAREFIAEHSPEGFAKAVLASAGA